MKDIYTLSEVADMLGVTKETLRRWGKSGKLASVRHPINNYRVYRSADLLPLMESLIPSQTLAIMRLVPTIMIYALVFLRKVMSLNHQLKAH